MNIPFRYSKEGGIMGVPGSRVLSLDGVDEECTPMKDGVDN